MGIVCAIYAILYAFFAILVARWNRGILPVAAALSMILAIFCAVGAESWFDRDRAGFDEALLPSSLIGLLVIVLGLLQIVLIAASLYAFNQEWHVEEERPIGSGEDYGAGASPSRLDPALSQAAPEWRNWHTRSTQNRLPLRACRVRIPPPASSERG